MGKMNQGHALHGEVKSENMDHRCVTFQEEPVTYILHDDHGDYAEARRNTDLLDKYRFRARIVTMNAMLAPLFNLKAQSTQ